MSQNNWVQLINAESYNQISAGSTLSNSNTLTDVSPGGNTAGQALVLPAGFLYSGLQLRVRANGIVSTTGSPSMLIGVYFGGVAGTVLAATTVTASANMSNATWELDASIRCDGTGTSGTLRTQGKILGMNSSGLAMLPATSATGGSATVNTGSNQILTLGFQWGTANASNSLTCYQFLVESLD